MSLTNASPEDAGQAARLASRKLAVLPVEARNAALDAVHDALLAAKAEVLEANQRDLLVADQAVVEGTLSQSIVKRLDLARPGKYDDMLQGILDVKSLPDPRRRTANTSSKLSTDDLQWVE